MKDAKELSTQNLEKAYTLVTNQSISQIERFFGCLNLVIEEIIFDELNKRKNKEQKPNPNQSFRDYQAMHTPVQNNWTK